MNRFSILCGWLAQRQGWRVKGEYDRMSKLYRLRLTPDLTTRDLCRSRRWATGNDNFVYSSVWEFKSSFTCRKILRHGIFPLYFPSERKACCGFLSPLKIHRLGRFLNPQPLGPVASTLTTTPHILSQCSIFRQRPLVSARERWCESGYETEWSVR
jgi:hypothetical protein